MTQKEVSKQIALDLLTEIEENVNICCAITMEPDDVQVLIDKLRIIINNNIT